MKTGHANITTEEMMKLANAICEAKEWEAEVIESGDFDAKIASFATEDEALEFLALGQVATGIFAPELILQQRRDGRINLLLFTGEE